MNENGYPSKINLDSMKIPSTTGTLKARWPSDLYNDLLFTCIFGFLIQVYFNTCRSSLSILQLMTPLLLTALYKVLNNPENRKVNVTDFLSI